MLQMSQGEKTSKYILLLQKCCRGICFGPAYFLLGFNKVSKKEIEEVIKRLVWILLCLYPPVRHLNQQLLFLRNAVVHNNKNEKAHLRFIYWQIDYFVDNIVQTLS